MHHRRSPLLLRAATLVALMAVVAVALPAAATDRVVVVHRGDTLSEIAMRHGVTVARLMALNTIADPNRIYPGQRLHLAGGSTVAPKPAAAEPVPVVHVVAPGEHLTGIARRYGTTIAAIVKANAIANPSYLRVGQRLVIPGAVAVASPTTAQAASASAAAARTYIVAAGENLSGIALRQGTTIAAIVKANGIANPSYLRVGQRLVIPGSGGQTATLNTRLPASMAAPIAARSGVRAIIVAEARVQGVPVAFALAVAWQESGWRADVVSWAGAIGVMQLTPPTADWVAGSMLGHSVHLYDAHSNVQAGVRLLKHYLARYHGNQSLVLAAYYQGQTGADQYGVYPMTRSYISSILALESIFAR